MKKTTKTLNMLIALLMALLMLPSFPVLAEDAQTVAVPANDNPLALDIVILIDQSSRMVDASGEGADPEGYRMDAAMIMLSMCDMEYSNAAINWYGLYYEDPAVGGKYQLLSLGSPLKRLSNSNRDRFNNMLTDPLSITHESQKARSNNGNEEDGLVNNGAGTNSQKRTDNDPGGKGNGRYYDFATAFSDSVKALKESESGNRRVILLISAGQPIEYFHEELPTTDNNKTERKLYKDRKSEYDTKLEQAKQDAKDANIEIYVIDVNTAGSGGNAALLTELDYRQQPDVIKNPAELPVIMNQIFADLIGSKMFTSTTNGSIEIENQSVKEVNIIVPKNGANGEISLFDPDGNKINDKAGQSSEYIVTDGIHFKTYKLLSPSVGKWTLKDTVGPVTAGLQYVFSYDVVAESKLMVGEQEPEESFGKNAEFTITTVFTEDEKPSSDKYLYSSIDAKLLIRERNNKGKYSDKASIAMNGNTDKRCFEYSLDENFPDLSEGTYSFFVKLEGAGLEREEYLGEYTLVNHAPQKREELTEEASDKENALTGFICNSKDGDETNVMDPIEINLDDYFFEPDGDECSYSIVGEYSEDVATAKLNGNKLTITPRAGGNTAVKISCEDDDENNPLEANRDFSIEVTDASGKYEECGVQLIVSVDGEVQESSKTYSVNKGAEISFSYSVTGETTEGDTPVLKDPDFSVMSSKGENYSTTDNFTQKCGEYTVTLKGKFGESVFPSDSATITVVNQSPELTADGEKLPDVFKGQLDGGGFILSLFGDQPEGTYWIDSKYLCSPTSDQTFDLSQYFTDPDGKEHDELKYTVSVYGPKGNDENGGETLGEILIENESILPTEVEGEETYLFTLKNDSFRQAGVHTVIFKAEDNDGASKEITLTLDVRSVTEKGEENFKRLLLYIAIGIVAFLIIRRMLMPKFKPGMHFYIRISDNREDNSEHYLVELGKIKDEHPMSEIYDSRILDPENYDTREDAFDALVIKPAYGKRIKVMANKKKFAKRPYDVEMKVSDQKITNAKFQSVLTTGDSISFQIVDDNQYPVGKLVEYVFMANDD